MGSNPPDMTVKQGKGPQVSPLEALETMLPQEAFNVIRAVLCNLDQRLSAVENSIVAPQHLQNIAHSTLSNTHFTINMSAGAPPTEIPSYVNLPEIILSPFSGKDNENIRIWISITEDSMCASEVPRDKWTYYVAPMLRDAASLWYYAKKTENNDQAPRWDVLRQAMLDYWDYPARIQEFSLRLDRITYRGSVSDYVRLFQGVEIQIPADAMPFEHRKRNFLSRLPAELAMQLDQQSQSDMAGVYLAARRAESHRKVADAQSLEKQKLRKDIPAPSIHHNHTTMPLAYAPTSAVTMAPAEPMGLDATTVSWGSRPPLANARCYNCNEIGHLAWECQKALRRTTRNQGQEKTSTTTCVGSQTGYTISKKQETIRGVNQQGRSFTTQGANLETEQWTQTETRSNFQEGKEHFETPSEEHDPTDAL